MVRTLASLSLILLAAACGGDPPQGADAAPAIDATPAAAVEEVTCPATVAAEVGVAGGQYAPAATTIAPGQVVRFTASADHSMRSNPSGQFDVPFGEVGCVRFNAADTYQFYCTAHGFIGSITVTP